MLARLRVVYFGFLLYCLFFFVAWTVQIVRQRKPDYSVPRGTGVLGVLSAFTRGMLPWRKDSAKLNLFSYTSGVLYHLASFSCLVILAFPVLLHIESRVLVYVLLVGFVCGVYLLLKRAFRRNLKLMSGPDDYLANVLVDLMQLSVLMAILRLVPPLLCYIVAYVVLLYLPFGKLRHCYYFFASRLLLGRSYGRRGVML